MFIYPAIDLRDGKCVRLMQGDYARETVFHADPTLPAVEFARQGADRLHLVDLDGAKLGTPTNGAAIRAIIDATGLPCQVGGGIRSEADLERIFSWGVRWAVLGTRALQDPAWLCRMAEHYPDQIVLGVDARDGFVATEGWLSNSSTLAMDLIREVHQSPLAAIVYTDIARDGMMQGPNFAALRDVRSQTHLKVIASGGVSTLEQVRQLSSDRTYGAIIGRALYENALTLSDALAVS